MRATAAAFPISQPVDRINSRGKPPEKQTLVLTLSEFVYTFAIFVGCCVWQIQRVWLLKKLCVDTSGERAGLRQEKATAN